MIREAGFEIAGLADVSLARVSWRDIADKEQETTKRATPATLVTTGKTKTYPPEALQTRQTPVVTFAPPPADNAMTPGGSWFESGTSHPVLVRDNFTLPSSFDSLQVSLIPGAIFPCLHLPLPKFLL